MLLPRELDRFVAATAPSHTPVQAEMAEYAETHDFPIIGRSAGGLLASLAQARNAARVFEFGSGFGYSASWLLRGMAPGGSAILTEIDADELALAEEYLDAYRSDYELTFELGNALEIVDRYDGPFDVVVIDHEKAEYADAFERVKDKLAPGGVIVADNIMQGPVTYEDLLPHLEGETETAPSTDREAGLLSYLQRVTDDPAIHTTVLPVGSGLALSAVNPERF